jgi:hypothetical protein
VVVRCRPIGVLKMTDEAGEDAKVLAVPIDKILSWYKHWREPKDIQPERLEQIRHFFQHYKDLEKGKWVKVAGWADSAEARREIMVGVESFAKASAKAEMVAKDALDQSMKVSADKAKPAAKKKSKVPAKSKPAAKSRGKS